MSTNSQYIPPRPRPAMPPASALHQISPALMEYRDFLRARLHEAEASVAEYEIVSNSGRLYDGLPETCRVRRIGGGIDRTYTVSRATGACSCPCHKQYVNPLRARLIAAGRNDLAALVVCKHCYLTELLHADTAIDPFVPDPLPSACRSDFDRKDFLPCP